MKTAKGTPENESKITLTPREVANLCGFGITHTYKMLQDGRLPSIRVGKKFYTPRVALERFLANCGRSE